MRKTPVLFLFGSLALVAFGPRCSSNPPDCTQTSTCPTDASDGPPPLACDMTKDPKDAPGCLDDRVGIFVSTTGSDTNAGTKAAPVQTVAKAISLATKLTRIYVCEGMYAEDVSLAPPADGISLYGGFKCTDWTYSGNKPQIGKGTTALKITGTTKPIAIQDFLVKAADGTASAPSSIAALVASATAAVTFTRVNLTAGKGLDGANGAAGANYSASLLPSDASIAGHNANASTGGTLQTCGGLCTDTIASTGGQGGVGGAAPSDGSDGAPLLGGGLHGSHASGCGSGGSGGNGGDSTTVGADATATTTLGALDPSGWTSSAGAGGKNGSPGQGGGGGAGQTGTGVGGGAGGGCGGCGGGGGVGGGGGGASIALAVVSSSVTVAASELHASDAGNGGKGSAGQVGQTGGYSGTQSNPGCLGGNGGKGSAGGTSAGGAGGVSVGVLYKGGNAPTLDSATTGAVTMGKAGAKGVGGKAGTNDGIDGVAMATFQSP